MLGRVLYSVTSDLNLPMVMHTSVTCRHDFMWHLWMKSPCKNVCSNWLRVHEEHISQCGSALCACSSQREEALSLPGLSLAPFSFFLGNFILLEMLELAEATGWLIQEMCMCLGSECFKDQLMSPAGEEVCMAVILQQSRMQISRLGLSTPQNHSITKLHAFKIIAFYEGGDRRRQELRITWKKGRLDIA